MKQIIALLILMATSAPGFAQFETEKENYKSAFAELTAMLNNEAPTSFKRATFISENAYLDNQLDYTTFCFQINALSKLARSIAVSDGLLYDKADRNQVLYAGAIFRLMKDSLVFESTDKKIQMRNIPFTYDMEDFWGDKDWTKMFVTKLLYEQTGNCHSLPALYKIIADDMGVKSWLSTAPNHTYIKQWADQTGWYNTELTTGQFPFDKDIKWNSYIKSEAIGEGVYMDTLSSRQTIAYVITDLVQGYVRKVAYTDIETALEWIQTALDVYPNYPNALILKAELLKFQYQQVMSANNVEDFKALWKDSKIKDKFHDLELAYLRVDQIGYRRMPKEMYLNWLFRARKDSTRMPYKFKSPQPFSQYNYTVNIATAGDGENYEFYDQTDIVRIGTIELNRSTGKIIKFVTSSENEMPDEVISRMYDPALGRFWQVDPLAQKRYSVTPYNFVQNNPINRVDPDGLTDFSINRKTGEIKQVGEANDDPDRIVRTDKNGNVKRKGEGFLGSLVRDSKKGEAKVAIGGIEKGILKDGINFQNDHNTIAVGGEGQPSLAGVQDFALKMSNHLNKEMGGFYLANKGEKETSYVAFGPYKNNDSQNERSGLRIAPDLLGKVDPTTHFHTHLSRFGDSDRLNPSSLSSTGGDEGFKKRQLAINPSLRFIIITNQSQSDNRASEHDY